MRMNSVAIRGMRYAYREFGDGRPLLLLHGFTGSSLTWAEHAQQFARHFRVIAVDLPGHGQTEAPADRTRFGFESVVADLAEFVLLLDAAPAFWLGYSMGARLALFAGLAHAPVVNGLILEGGSPGIADSAERAQRRRNDELLADRIESRGVSAFVDYWETLPLFASQLALPPERRRDIRAIREANSAEGLAGGLRGMGNGVQPTLWHRLGQLTQPTLLIVGENDHKFVDINRRMASLIPGWQLTLIPGAGHATHIEQPVLFQAAVLRFLTGLSAHSSQYLPNSEEHREEQSRQGHLLEPGIQRRQVLSPADRLSVADEQRNGQQEKELP